MRKQHTDHAAQPELGLPEVRPLWETAGLFSDHYLKTRLRQNAWWPTDDQARPHWEFCRDLYNRRYLALAKGNEAAVRQELIDHVLRRLGFDWIDNLSLPDQDAEPDYLLFASSADKEAVLEASTAQRYRAAAAIIEAKKLHHPLSQLSKHQLRYPHQQIRDYLIDAQVLGWGILTNGNMWRLYCREARRHEYFELNFEVAIQSLEAFKCFLALFTPEAFRRERGRCRLDDIRDQAMAVQTELEENLRLRVFTILTELANGFASRYANRIEEGNLDRLYENCLIYLYRLLFVLYAEGRGLLPVNRPDRKYYKNLSLARLRRSLQDFSEYDDRHLTRLGESIRDLFRLIDGAGKGVNEDYGVPCYNGGLFDPLRYPLLEEWKIADPDLAAVLRGLMFSPPPERDKPTLPIETVDFGDLRIQHLGSIYEGLLEHRLVRGDDGRLRLDVDRAERKATGTYYTPDYIVKYIVENTVGPLLKEIEESEAVKAAVTAKRRDDAFAEQVLKLSILDPAMGSGHFLVETVTYLADHIVHHPTTQYLDGDKRGEPKAEQEIARWRRHVVEACIYGVDMNPLAVELAKLSLWLVTIATDKPLNFLDHHLRCGNSLIGARLDDLGELPEKRRKWMVKEAAQAGLVFGPSLKEVVSAAIREIHRIEGEASDSVTAVKAKEGRWEQHVIRALAPYKAIADLWTATYFGFDLDSETYTSSAARILRVGYRFDLDFTELVEREDYPGRKLTEWRDTAAARRFFHWELEFPEIFFNEDGSPKDNSGFDAVIGNPPYIPNEAMDAAERDYMPQRYPVAAGKYDMSVVFVKRCGQLLAANRLLGMIMPQTWQTGDSYRPFRESWLHSAGIAPVRLVNLPFDVFPDAYVDTCIALFRRGVIERVAVFRLPRRGNLPECMPKENDFDMVLAQQVVDEQYHRLFASPSLYGFLSRFTGPLCWILGDVTEACQGPVESFFEYSPTEKDDDFLPYATCSVDRYCLQVSERQFIRFGKDNPLARFYAGPRVLVRRLVSRGDRLMAVATEDPFVVKKDLNPFVCTSKNLSLYYILGNLNSRLHSHLYTEASAAAGKDDFRQTTLAELQVLPIRRIDFSTPEAERNRHAKKAQQTYERGMRDNDAGSVLALVDEHLKASRMDVIHDLLAFLAERMMRLNKEKREGTNGFLTDLKEFHGVDAHSLKPKTRLDEFWTLEVADVFAHLKANVRTLAVQGVRLKEADEEKIRSRFQKAKERIVPLEASLSFTDRLIDRIVYCLYDLTPDEIALVEEPA